MAKTNHTATRLLLNLKRHYRELEFASLADCAVTIEGDVTRVVIYREGFVYQANGKITKGRLSVRYRAKGTGSAPLAWVNEKSAAIDITKDPEFADMKTHEPLTLMTCQVCGRKIHAKNGTIAHHGYQRPYDAGFQTSSCLGARHVPFELDKAVLEYCRDSDKAALDVARDNHDGVASGRLPVTVIWTDYNKPANRFGRPQDRASVANEAEFLALVAAHPAILRHRHGYSFENAKRDNLFRIDDRIRALYHAIENAEKRLHGWKATHAYSARLKAFKPL